MVAVFASIYNKKIFYVRNGIIYYKENSLRLFSVVIIFYVLSGIYALTKTRKKLGIKQYIFMQTWNIVIIMFLRIILSSEKEAYAHILLCGGSNHNILPYQTQCRYVYCECNAAVSQWQDLRRL